MGQKKIKKDAFKEFKKRKLHTKEALKSPHPIVTLVYDAAGEVIKVGTDREVLAKCLEFEGTTHFEMRDFAVTV